MARSLVPLRHGEKAVWTVYARIIWFCYLAMASISFTRNSILALLLPGFKVREAISLTFTWQAYIFETPAEIWS